VGVRVIVLVRAGSGGVMLIPHCYRITPKSHCSTSTGATSAQLRAIRSGHGSGGLADSGAGSRENPLFEALKNGAP
jgi:hypothetical protein